jgi:hypothetical protein
VSRRAKDIADVHSTLWPVEQKQETILNLAVLTGQDPPQRHQNVEPKALPGTEQ